MADTRDSGGPGGSDRQADEALAARWMAEHWDAMVDLARQWAAGHATTPEDIAQAALLAAYERRARLVDPAGERAWLLAFVRNKAREAVRWRMRHGRKLPLEYADLETDVRPAACNDWRREQVLDAAAGLPGKQRGIVDFILDGCSDDEIAVSTGLKKGTVWVYKHRAVRELKEVLGPQGARVGSSSPPATRRRDKSVRLS